MNTLPPTARLEPLGRFEVIALLVLALASAVLVAIAWSGNETLMHWLTSETGPLEWLSARAWFLIAALLLWRGPRGATLYALAALCIVFGLRELDLHKVIAHTSFLKNAFYRDPSISSADKALGGALAFGTVGIVLTGLLLGTRAYLRRRLYRSSWGRVVLGAAVLLVLSKLLDRIPATLAVDYGIALETHLKAVVSLHEEWLECYVPLLYVAAAWRAPA